MSKFLAFVCFFKRNSNLKPNLRKVTTPNINENVKHTKIRLFYFILKVFGVSITFLSSVLVYKLGAPEIDNEGNIIGDNLGSKPIWIQYIIRTYRELLYLKKLIQHPSREKLLPDPLEYPYVQPKYTLVLELTDVLVHSECTHYTDVPGWRFKKRPFLEYFLKTLKDSYEIIIYTSEQGITVFPLVEAIDPKKIIAYKLVRDATHYTHGHHVKDLNNINRDMSKVICVDWEENNVKMNTENLLKIKRWNGNNDDTSLLDLTMLLKTIADNNITDVREVLAYYSKYEDPISEFKEKQRRLIEQMDDRKLPHTTKWDLL